MTLSNLPAAPSMFGSGEMASPIRHLIVCANPSADSFDHSIVAAYVEAVTNCSQIAEVRDLYALGFDPVLKVHERPGSENWIASPDVSLEIDHLANCDVLVLVYPIWFGLPPAILKGYVDRVLGAGYSFAAVRDRIGQSMLKNKPLLSFSTSGNSAQWLDHREQVLALRKIFDVYLWQAFGMKQSDHVMIDNVVPDLSSSYATEQLGLVKTKAKSVCEMLTAEFNATDVAQAAS